MEMILSHQLVSVALIGQLLELTPRRVQQLAAEGVIPRAAHGQYDLILTVRAYVRRTRHEVDLSSSGLSGASLRVLRSRLMTIPATIAPLLTSSKTTYQTKKIIRAAIAEALASYDASDLNQEKTDSGEPQ